MFASGITVQAQTISKKPVTHSSQKSGRPIAKKEKLNVIFFLVDDMGWKDVGYAGSKFYETPHIDHFAKEGVRFTQAYAACHVCSPSRASILTGEYPARLHLTDWLPGRGEFPFQKLKNAEKVQHLPYDQPTLPKVLKENGYRTALIGKWHLGEDSASTLRQGFDLHIPDYNRGWATTYFSPYGMKGLEGGPKGEYLTDRLTSEALKFIEQNKDNPFFLYISHFAVHDPLHGKPDLVEKYEKKLKSMEQQQGPSYILEGNPDTPDPSSREELNALLNDKRYESFTNLPDRTVKIKQYQDNPQFAAMVETVDESLGCVLSKLKNLGLTDKTIVIFFSDNGGMSAANFNNPKAVIPVDDLNNAFSTSNLPLRGGKGWLYEGGIREPMIIKWPNEDQPGTVCNVPVISTDFYPTILNMLGIPFPQGQHNQDGMSIVPLLKNEQETAKKKIEKRAMYWHFPQYSNHGQQSPGGAVRYGDYKLIEYYEHNTVQLFDIKNDPGEQHDLAQLKPARIKELTKMLHTWLTSVNANMPTPNPSYDPALDDQWQNWVRPTKGNN